MGRVALCCGLDCNAGGMFILVATNTDVTSFLEIYLKETLSMQYFGDWEHIPVFPDELSVLYTFVISSNVFFDRCIAGS